MAPGFMDELEKVRQDYAKQMTINSGFRCPAHNAKLPGAAKNSYHMLGLAVDIACPDPMDRYALVAAAIKHRFTGIKIYSWGIHLDRRFGSPLILLAS